MRRDIDPEALNLFLKHSYIPSPWTIFKNIRKLPPGHMLCFRDGKTEIQGCWEFPTQDNPVTDIDSAVEKYRVLLRQSIERRVRGDGATGILLSGGLDSSANVALAAQCRGSKIKTFSVGFDDHSFDEREYARIVSRHYGTEHFEYTITGEEIEELPRLVWNLEEPYFEFGLFLTYLGLASAQGEANAVIGGEGADQLFGTGGFAGGMAAALHYLFVRAKLLGPAQRAARLLKADYFYAHDNKAFKARMLWDSALQAAIARSGCVVIELLPGTPPWPWHFPSRNRILAGIARGVLVVQAEHKSGALSTARLALQENRDVMAVPGDVQDPRSRGPHALLRQGAALVESAGDVLHEFGWHAAADADADTPQAAQAAVLAALAAPLAADELRLRLAWQAPRLQHVLAELELLGLVERDVRGRIRRALS